MKKGKKSRNCGKIKCRCGHEFVPGKDAKVQKLSCGDPDYDQTRVNCTKCGLPLYIGGAW